jgi:hypothetical protein
MNANALVTARMIVLVALYYVGMLACAYLFMVWRVIYERYHHKPPEDGHTRAAEREERWYPMGPLGLVRDRRRVTLKIHIDQLTKKLLR